MTRTTILKLILPLLLCLPTLVGKAQSSFPYPSIPDSLREPHQRAQYLVSHYWDRYDFADTTLLHIQEIAELGFVNFVDLMRSDIAKDCAREGMLTFASRLLKPSQDYFVDLAEKYLYDWASPMRNDSLYTIFADAFAETGHNDTRLEWLKQQLGKNAVGSAPADISLTMRNGLHTKLSDIAADYVVVMFYQPDCEECQQAVERLHSLHPISYNNAPTVCLAIYYGDDIDLWRKSALAFPDSWLDCYNTDNSIIQHNTYHIRHTPSLYVIDQKRHKVVAKDLAAIITKHTVAL